MESTGPAETNEDSLVFERVIGSLGSALDPEDGGDQGNDAWEGSEIGQSDFNERPGQDTEGNTFEGP